MMRRHEEALRLTWLGLVLLCVVAISNLTAPPAQAQSSPPAQAPSQAAPAKSPFGIVPPTAQKAPQLSGKSANAGILDRVSFWILEKQAEYNRGLVQAVRRFKTESFATAAGALAFLSFLYGVFHAAGPGHGKAIISSYVLANEQTARRGVLIAFISSVFQALSAILIVGVMSLALRATSLQMQAAEAMIERVSFGLVTLVGAWLLFGQVRKLVMGKSSHPHTHAHAHGDGHGQAHGQFHGHAHHHHDGHGHDHADAGHIGHMHAAGEACDHCDHAHLPGPEQLVSGWSWKRALALSFAVGVRPCSGAILVLVFALTQGLFLAGVFATFAMALGTALTVSALAVMAVVSRDWAARMTGGGAVVMERISMLAGLLGSALVFIMGLLLFWGSFGPVRPF